MILHRQKAVLHTMVLAGVWATLALGGTISAQTPTRPGSRSAQTSPLAPGFFEREVEPLLEKNCLGCHGIGARLSGLDLRTRGSALQGGTRGPALVPGSAEKSLLYRLMTGARAPEMPPTGRLPTASLQIVKKWLDGGAPWAGSALVSAQKQVWWSFKPPVLSPVPQFKQIDGARSKISNPIDAFVQAKLRAAGLSPAPPAPRRVLIRRVTLDLIGLPPTPEEVEAFVNDRSPNAYEKLVDRLLASPRYGERWGRHWLDLVRYADSGGFEGDKDRPLAWRYRDYVIDAFNHDKPYNLFLQEQIAGDERPPGDNRSDGSGSDRREAIIATGYLACGPQDIVEKNERTRANELDDLVSTTGSVVLGLTIGCARCHDHKYDPIRQTDYYRLAAIFAPSERREIEVPTPAERQQAEAHNAAVESELVPLRQQLQALRQQGLQAARKADGKAGQTEPTEAQAASALSPTDRAELARLQAAIKTAEARRIALPRALAVTDKGREFPDFHLLIRGDAYHPGERVAPGFICALPGGTEEVTPDAATAQTTGRRSALARWLVRPQNPLTARVWMNRVWRQHFGRGLVNTPSNFGISGELPSHPELLDWLALTFQSTGWKLKPMHRLMLLSSTYQQASDGREATMQSDPQNRLYGRMPMRRLEAEAVRDSILAVAGTLNREMGGPPVYPPVDPSLRADTFQGVNWPEGEDSPKTWRRSVYVKVKRSLLLPELEVFDCPEITYSVPQRNVTTTPLQALMLLNDPLIRRQAALFADRLRRDAGSDPGKQTERAYQLAFGRAPTAQEIRWSIAFMNRRGPTALADFCHALFNVNEFVYVP